MLLRIDFIDVNDRACRYSRRLTDFGYIHMGIRLDDLYLFPIQGQKTEWKDYKIFERYLSDKIGPSYLILPNSFDPSLLMSIVAGRKIDNFWKLFYTEIPLYLVDNGVNIIRPHRSACVDVARDILQHVNIPVEAYTARRLDQELERLSWIPGSGVATA